MTYVNKHPIDLDHDGDGDGVTLRGRLDDNPDQPPYGDYVAGDDFRLVLRTRSEAHSFLEVLRFDGQEVPDDLEWFGVLHTGAQLNMRVGMMVWRRLHWGDTQPASAVTTLRLVGYGGTGGGCVLEVTLDLQSAARVYDAVLAHVEVLPSVGEPDLAHVCFGSDPWETEPASVNPAV